MYNNIIIAHGTGKNLQDLIMGKHPSKGNSKQEKGSRRILIRGIVGCVMTRCSYLMVCFSGSWTRLCSRYLELFDWLI